MVNNYSKMRRSQVKAREYFEKTGGLVWMIQHTRFFKDIFGLWDGFVIMDKHFYFIQVKSNSFPDIKPYKEFCEKYGVEAFLVNVKDREGVEVKFVSKDKGDCNAKHEKNSNTRVDN